MSMNPDGVEEDEVGLAAANDVGTSEEQIESLEAELADTKGLLAAVAGAVRSITRQFEEAMVAGIMDNGTGGITDGWSAVSQNQIPDHYLGIPALTMPKFNVPVPLTADYALVNNSPELGPVAGVHLIPLSNRAQTDELHRLHRAVLAMRGILIGTGISTQMLDQIVGDLRCGSCHLTPIAPGSYRVTEPGVDGGTGRGESEVKDRRSLAQQIVDEYEARTQDSMVADVVGLPNTSTGQPQDNHDATLGGPA